MVDVSAGDDRAKKDRSPSYPFIGLKRAVVRLQQLVENHKRSPARLQSVAASWGYGIKSSGLLQTAASLKQYGLIDDAGSGIDRKIQVSDLGWRYLHDEREGAKIAALQEAALKPKLFAEYNRLWAMGRPNDAHCISELQFDRGFTVDAAKLFLKAFDETIAFSNLRDPDRISEVRHEIDDGADSSNDSGVIPIEQPLRALEQVAPKATASMHNAFEIGLKSDPVGLVIEAVLRDQNRVDALITALQAMKVLLPKETEAPQPN